MKKVLMVLTFAVYVTLSYAGEAKDLVKIKIPGAKCGNGDDYSVFVNTKDPEKLVVTFQSGGACWSKSTCYGPNLRAMIKAKKKGKVPKMISKTPYFDNHSQVFFPYCTGDTFTGSHVSNYSKKVYHYGDKNISLSLDYLQKTGKFQLNKVNDLVVYGGSAGAIGALVQSKKLEEAVHVEAKKTLIIDSPGLHFGHDFWERFSNASIRDFKNSFERINFMAPLNDGFVAPYLAETCNYLSDWNIGFIMGSKDIVMSRIFGRISMKDHHKLVYSSDGIIETLKQTNNCSLWVKKSRIHTFLQGFPTWKRKVRGVRAIDFVTSVYNRNEQRMVIDKP